MSSNLTLSIPANRVPEALADFPAKIDLSPGGGMAAIFTSITDNWAKLYIYNAADESLPISVQRWSAVDQTAQIVVLVDVPDPSVETSFAIVFGLDLDDNPLIGAEGSVAGSAAYDASTLAAWAACQDPSVGGTPIIDGKGVYHGTPNGVMTSDDVVEHVLGMGLQFDGADDWISLPAFPALTTWTMACTVTPLATTNGDGILVINGSGLVLANGYLAGMQGNNVIRRGSSVINGSPVRLVITWDGSAMAVYEDGSVTGSDLTNPGWGLSGVYRIASGYLAGKPSMVASDLSVSTVVRSAGWIAADYLAITGGLFGSAVPELTVVLAALEGNYGLCLETAMVGRYGDAAIISAGLVGRYGNAATVQAALLGRYGDMVPVLAALEGRYHLMHSVLAGLVGEYAICGSSVLAALDGRYDLRERNEITAALVGYYSLLPGATIQQIVCPVRIGGVSVRWSSVSWTLSEDSYLIEATVVLRDPSEFGSIAKLDTVEIDWSGTTYTLFVSAKLRSRSVSGDAGAAEYGADYTIIARSLTAGLDAPYALSMTMSWPATTLASAIAADLIASLPELITLDFRLEDWLQPGGTFFLTDESPLEGLRKLAAIIGGIVQTSPSNALILRMTDPTPPAEWAKVVPAWTIEDSGLFSDSESESESNSYNVITVSNQGESDRSTRFEIEDITEYRKRVRGYRVPWADFGLATSGGAWVTIEDGGVVEEPVTDEVVEFVEGSSSAPLPVYSMVSVVWLQASLGAITAAEDGSLTSEVVGNSLAKISYTTRCHMWIGTSDRSEEVQFYEVEK